MTEQLIRELIADKDNFMKYVRSTIVSEETEDHFGLKETTYKDELGREVFWELANSYQTRQYRLYPSKYHNYYIVYFTLDGMIAFMDENSEDCSEAEFFSWVNNI